MAAQVTRVSGRRDHHHQHPQHDLDAAGEPGGVDHAYQVVADEPAAVPGLARVAAQVVLQRRERAGEADELDQRPVHHDRQLHPDDLWPAPGEEYTADDEADEQQVDGDHEVSSNAVPHQITVRTPRPVPSVGRLTMAGLARHDRRVTVSGGS
jgi:hypothetical protein